MTTMTTSSYSQFITVKIRECIDDLRRVTPKNLNLTNPFHYLPWSSLSSSISSSSSLELLGQSSLNNTVKMTTIATTTTAAALSSSSSSLSPYYSDCRESSDKHFNIDVGSGSGEPEQACEDMRTSPVYYNYYYQNCIVEFVLRLFVSNQSRSTTVPGNHQHHTIINERFNLVQLLLDLAPANLDLIKQFVAFSQKVNGLHKTVQLLYDHLYINCIDNEHLWIL